MFVDQVQVILKAGKGGNGCVSFRREYRVPKGGPDGGRGGDGGNVYLVAENNLNSLSYFRFHPINKAKSGRPGEGSNRSGKQGAELRLHVPVGTVVREKGKDRVLADFLKPGQTYLAARGGKGGRGNASYATSTHQTPREFEAGQPGEEKELILELKLIADIGLVGFPNVGKSTLISRISAARPAIADYPFTTLIPNLGVVDLNQSGSFVVADIPGLIEGAHSGHGLGMKFLRHIERTKVIAHLIDVSPASGRDPVNDYQVIMKELSAFSPALAARPQVLVANKIDLLSSEERLKSIEELARGNRVPFFAVSALKKQGLKRLVAGMVRALEEAGKKESGRP